MTAVDPGQIRNALDHIETELGDVEHALRRLDQGTYATCGACGGPIPEERLAGAPTARSCRDEHQR